MQRAIVARQFTTDICVFVLIIMTGWIRVSSLLVSSRIGGEG